MRIIVEKAFETRQDLDSFVASRFGTDPVENAKHEVEITTEEAVKLSLSTDTTIFGTRVIVKELVDKQKQ